jgi:hypothetical protein
MLSASQGPQNKVNLAHEYNQSMWRIVKGNCTHALVVMSHKDPFQLEGGDLVPTTQLPPSPRFFTPTLPVCCLPLAPDGAAFVRGLEPSHLFACVAGPPPLAIVT